MIDCFDGNYAFLSNFYEFDPPIEVVYSGIDSIEIGKVTVNTVEVAYQAGKAKIPALYEKFTAREAKKIGKHELMNPVQKQRWDSYMKLQLMERLLLKKFDNNHPQLQQMLLSTGDEELIEGNYWKDTYWGVCNGVGENHLGKLLMKIREKLKEK